MPVKAWVCVCGRLLGGLSSALKRLIARTPAGRDGLDDMFQKAGQIAAMDNLNPCEPQSRHDVPSKRKSKNLAPGARDR